MKQLICAISLTLIFSQIKFTSSAQCTANAGNDTLLCSSDFNQGYPYLQIGGSPSASGGNGNYHYTWTTFFQNNYGSSFTASYFLNDTSSSNPNLIQLPVPFMGGSDSLVFHLLVTDDSGVVCTDSMQVVFDNWYTYLIACQVSMNAGDSIHIGICCNSDFPMVNYHWSPNYNMDDTASATPLVWPATQLFYYYYYTVTDSRGCSCSGDVTVFIEPTSVNSIYSGENFSEIFPNPINESSVIRFENSDSRKLQVEIFNFIGKKILQTLSSGTSIQIGNAAQASGQYFYRISLEGKTISTGKFTKSG